MNAVGLVVAGDKADRIHFSSIQAFLLNWTAHIMHVETTSAPVSDDAMTATIHAELDRKALLPAEHSVDTGYFGAKLQGRANGTT